MAKKRIKSDFSSIFDDNSMMEDNESISTLRLSEIEPNKNQPRKNFDKEALEQLAASIRENGVLQPLLVRPLATGNYQIIAGERRWRASKIAGLSDVPVVIRDDLSEEQVMQIALIENLQRENLNPIEEALGYKELIDNYKMTQDGLAKTLGKARSSIANSLGLLSLPKTVKDLLADGSLSVGHCKALKSIKDTALMTEIALRAADGELTVRSIEAIARREAKKDEEKTDEIKPRIAYYTEVELSLAELLGTKVKIAEGKKTNTLQISFDSKEQLEGIMKELIKNNQDAVICGMSAGSMNCANTVYCPPELEGESLDPNFQIYLKGLGLTDINIMPHFNTLQYDVLDGKHMVKDIILPESYNIEILAIDDYSYVLIENGEKTIYGSAYILKNGTIKQINENNNILEL